jgi:hypothetical protein
MPSFGAAFFVGEKRMTKSVVETGESVPPPQPMPVICDVCRKHGTAGEEGFVEIANILNFEPVPRRTQVNKRRGGSSMPMCRGRRKTPAKGVVNRVSSFEF